MIEVIDPADGTRLGAVPEGGAATRSGRPARAWRELQVGTVEINAAWGGAPGGSAEPRRQSGLGLGYGPGLLQELTAVKVVHIEPAPPA